MVAIFQKYVNEGHIVYGIDNLLNGNLNNVRTLLHRKNFKFIHDDVRNRDLYPKLPTDLDAIFHLAAQIHVDRSIVNPQETFDINVTGTMNILEYARMNDVNKILFASTSEIYGSANILSSDIPEETKFNQNNSIFVDKTSSQNVTMMDFMLKNDTVNDIYRIPATIFFKDFEGGDWIKIPPSEILTNVTNNIRNYGYAVIVLHQQDFALYANTTDQYGYNHINSVDRKEISDLSKIIYDLQSRNIRIGGFNDIIN